MQGDVWALTGGTRSLSLNMAVTKCLLQAESVSQIPADRWSYPSCIQTAPEICFET